MPVDKPYVRTLHIGKSEPLADTGVDSSINKKPVDTPQKVTLTGLIHDEQSDKMHHGGVDKAIHQYAFEHYETVWKQKIPDCNVLDHSGAFGENISSLGMTEKTVYIGDRYKIGSCVLEVSQARQPCWKLNYRFSFPRMSEEVQNSFLTGWYYRVIQEGEIQQGDTFELQERPYPKYTLAYLLDVLYKDCLNEDKLQQALQIKPLAESWKNIFRKRLETGKIENWERRLFK